MGQYYTPVIIENDKIKTLCCYDYDNGAKLMEHSYLRNSFVETVVKQLLDKKARLAWVGDYAEPDDVENELARKFIEAERIDAQYRIKPKHNKMENSYGLCFINHSKKEYFYMDDYVFNIGKDKYGFIIHPLPLLTAIGNGKGGGDYQGINMGLIGHWACDEIEVKAWIDEEKNPEYKNITSMIKFYEG